jgi:hypothetical protein
MLMAMGKPSKAEKAAGVLMVVMAVAGAMPVHYTRFMRLAHYCLGVEI